MTVDGLGGDVENAADVEMTGDAEGAEDSEDEDEEDGDVDEDGDVEEAEEYCEEFTTGAHRVYICLYVSFY
jgi:hypothetical protein